MKLNLLKKRLPALLKGTMMSTLVRFLSLHMRFRTITEILSPHATQPLAFSTPRFYDIEKGSQIHRAE